MRYHVRRLRLINTIADAYQLAGGGSDFEAGDVREILETALNGPERLMNLARREEACLREATAAARRSPFGDDYDE
jgi:hypothetical protein